MRQPGLLAALLIVDQVLQRMGSDAVCDPGIKTSRPIHSLLGTHLHLQSPQVVHRVSAGHDQHPLLTQSAKLLTDSKMIFSRSGVIHA